MSQLSASTPKDNRKPSTSASNKVLAHACVDSAIRTIHLLEVLLDFEDIPKRLPFVVNSIFVAALILWWSHLLPKKLPMELSMNPEIRGIMDPRSDLVALTSPVAAYYIHHEFHAFSIA